MKRMFALTVLMFFLTACSTTTVITREGKEIYTVKSRNDALVTYSDGTDTMKVDNRGRRSLLEDLLLLYGNDQLKRNDAE